MVEVTKMTSPDYLIEISAIAVLDKGPEPAGAHDATSGASVTAPG
jgi:hypothetical protein